MGSSFNPLDSSRVLQYSQSRNQGVSARALSRRVRPKCPFFRGGRSHEAKLKSGIMLDCPGRSGRRLGGLRVINSRLGEIRDWGNQRLCVSRPRTPSPESSLRLTASLLIAPVLLCAYGPCLSHTNGEREGGRIFIHEKKEERRRKRFTLRGQGDMEKKVIPKTTSVVRGHHMAQLKMRHLVGTLCTDDPLL